jgi:hypothetical protein
MARRMAPQPADAGSSDGRSVIAPLSQLEILKPPAGSAPASAPEQLTTTLQRLEEIARKRSEAKAATANTSSPAKPRMPASSGTPTPTVIAAANRQLETYLRERGIEQYQLFPSNEFPTPFTRLPLFPPVRRTTARKAAQAEDWTVLHSRWDGGGVFKAGPALTIYDEDTLIGLLTLRSQRLTGPARLLPIPAAASGTDPDDQVNVHTLYCLISQLETTIQGRTPKGGWGGRAIEKRRESLNRLAAVTLRFEQPKGANAFQGKAIRLFDIEYVSTKDESCYYVQIHSVVSAWLENYRTFLSLDLRRKLSSVGKALHRFLASQKSNASYSVLLSVLFEAIGVHCELRVVKRDAIVQLNRMRDEGFLHSYSITGNGRSEPWKLTVLFREPGSAPPSAPLTDTGHSPPC